MIKKLLPIVFLFSFLQAHSQAILTETYNNRLELYSLVMSVPGDIFATTNFSNATGQELFLEITSLNFDLPNNWNIDSSATAINIDQFSIPGGESRSLESHLLFGEVGIKDIGVGYQIINIVATNGNGMIIYEGEHTIEYEIFVREMPSPTFVLSTWQDSMSADTVLIGFDINQFGGNEFFGNVDFFVDDRWGIDRGLIFEPIEFITENVTTIDCEHNDPYSLDPDKSWCKGDTMSLTSSFIHGHQILITLDSNDEFRYEVYVNIYDPLDSLGSNHQVRFIGKSFDCVNGIYSDIVNTSTNEAFVCQGGNITLNALPEFAEVEWSDDFGNIYNGTSVNFFNIQDNIYLNITAYDDQGCLFYSNFYINIDEVFEPIVDNVNDSEQVSSCLGGTVNLIAKPEYSDVEWRNDITGEIFYGQEISIVDIQEYVNLYIKATKADGCTAYMYFYIYLEEMPGDIIEGYEGDIEIEVCAGADLVLNAKDEYTDVVWYKEWGTDSIFTQTLTLNNIEESTYYYLIAKATDGCTVYQYIYININTELMSDQNLVDESQIPSQLCRIIEFEANPGYTDIEWYYNEPALPNEVLFGTGPTAILDATDLLEFEYLDMLVRAKNQDNCNVEYFYPLEFQESVQRDLIDASGNGSFCEGDEIVLTALDTYTNYIWTYQGQTYNTRSITIIASNDAIDLLTFDELGCSYNDYYEVNLENLPVGDICLITNDAQTGNNVIFWESPQDSSNISSYSVFREGSSTNDYELLGSVAFDAPHIFEDKTADPTQQAYKYVVTSSNDCGNESQFSAHHKTIHLTINLGTNDNVNLIWDSYVGIQYDQVKIYRGSSLSSLEEYVSLPSTVLSFTDQNPPSGAVYYQIEIPNQVSCQSGKRDISIKSNVAFFEMDDVDDLSLLGSIFPNPFEDKLTLDLDQGGQLEIYNTTGQLVFETEIGLGKTIINTSEFKSGAYFLKLNSANNYYTANFIKI